MNDGGKLELPEKFLKRGSISEVETEVAPVLVEPGRVENAYGVESLAHQGTNHLTAQESRCARHQNRIHDSLRRLSRQNRLMSTPSTAPGRNATTSRAAAFPAPCPWAARSPRGSRPSARLPGRAIRADRAPRPFRRPR